MHIWYEHDIKKQVKKHNKMFCFLLSFFFFKYWLVVALKIICSSFLQLKFISAHQEGQESAEAGP